MKKISTKQFALILLLSVSSFTRAQFMCTDINPDTVVTQSSTGTYTWNIDVNNDNTGDFQYSLVLSGPTFGFLNFQSGVAGMTQNYVLVTGSGSISALNAGAPVASSSSSWHPMSSTNPNFFLMAAAPPVGSWAGETDKYVGVAVAVATNTFFGWIKMSVSGTIASYTVKEYGFNSVAGASIAAGQACSPPATFAVTYNLQDTICQNKTATVTANTGTVAATGYTWSSNPAGLLFSAPNSSVTNITFTATGIHTVNIAATSGSMTGTSSQTIFVKPVPVIAVFSSSNIICAGASAILTASSGASSFTWNTSATTSTISVSPSITTNYTVTGSLNGCTNTAVFTQSVIVCAGLAEVNEMEYGFTLFPNPSTGNINVRSNYSSQKNIEISVIDLVGKIQIQQEITFEDQNSIHQLSLKTISSGVYFVRLRSEDGNSKVIRMVKE